MKPTEIRAALVERWSGPKRLPFKGSLISETDGNVCMCAQGQALHYYGGWSFDQLRDAHQERADLETARLLGISRAHAVLLRQINDQQDGAPQIVLTNPEMILGQFAPQILGFWKHLDTLDASGWSAAGAAAGAADRDAAWDAAWDAARGAAGGAAGGAVWAAARDAAWDAARDAAWDAAWDAVWDAAGAAARGAAGGAAWGAARGAAGAAAGATNEIQGHKIMAERGQPLFFLPAFGFASVDEIPSE